MLYRIFALALVSLAAYAPGWRRYLQRALRPMPRHRDEPRAGPATLKQLSPEAVRSALLTGNMVMMGTGFRRRK